MTTTVQVSAHISVDTKERMERYVRATGTTRAHLVEQALLHHLQALEDLPLDIVVPARAVLDQTSAQKVRELLMRPPQPTEEMSRLFDDR